MNNQSRFAAVLTLCALSVFVSCKKDDNNPNAVTKKLTKYWYTSYPDTVSFTYDANGFISATEDSEDVETFPISGSSIHYKDFRPSENRTVADIQYTLNAKGQIVSGTGTVSYTVANAGTTQQTYEYDADGHLTKRTDARSDGNTYTYEYAYTNGNVVSEKSYTNGTLTFTTIREYSTTPDKIGLDVGGYISNTKGIFGKPNTHLQSHAKGMQPNGSVSWEYNTVYTLDADGYPTKLFLKRLDAAGEETVYYQFQ